MRIVDCKIATWPAGSCYNRFGTLGWLVLATRSMLLDAWFEMLLHKLHSS